MLLVRPLLGRFLFFVAHLTASGTTSPMIDAEAPTVTLELESRPERLTLVRRVVVAWATNGKIGCFNPVDWLRASAPVLSLIHI